MSERLILRESKMPARRPSRNQPRTNTPLLATRTEQSKRERAEEPWRPTQYWITERGWRRA